ncbi:MAG: mannonate dehydratase [Clostridiales bacterium]|jgi:mannonate dehydratase|nr:mannonate dehydratase [Clostridiales bacterium]
MKMTLRWFGENQDKVTLRQIAQIPGVDGVVTSFLDIPAGEVWPLERIKAMKGQVSASGLNVEVIESVNIHEDIKLGLPSRDKYIDNYIATLKNLREIGIKVICYNFMPVLDWARSKLFYELPDGSKTMFYDDAEIMSLTPEDLLKAFQDQSDKYEMPGWEPERLKSMAETIKKYDGMTEERFMGNMKYFLDRIIPYCEEYDIKMAIHPDDPPWPIFGLPRLIVNRDNIRRFLDLNSSPYNGLTLCTGSIGANRVNDVPAIISEFAAEGRIHFAHIRNLRFVSDRSFYESAHLTSCGSLDIYAIVKALHDNGFTGYIRPDHGRMIWGETGRAGYGLYDRALGAAYINGIWEALSR